MLHSAAARRHERAARRSVVLAVIVAVHVGLLLLLTSARIGVTRPPAVAAVVSFIDDLQAEHPPAPPPVRLVEPHLRLSEVPPILVDVAPVAASNAITVAAPPPATVAAAPPTDHGPRRVSAVEYLRAPQPHYPREARRHRTQGVVLLRVLVNESGAPLEIAIERSSGDRTLDDAARAAVARALFKPYRENGLARRALVTVPIEFSLRDVLASN